MNPVIIKHTENKLQNGSEEEWEERTENQVQEQKW